MELKEVRRFFITPADTVRHAAQVIDTYKEGIALVTDEEGKLLGTITDGDIRRFMLSGRSLDEPCSMVMFAHPASVSITASRSEMQLMLTSRKLRQLPLVNKSGVVEGLVTLRDFLPSDQAPSIAVIMAGGEGKRLRPITESIPKPMVEVGNKPLLETIVERLVCYGIRDIRLAVNYKHEIIENYFEDGKRFGANISYIHESKKLGTIGALTLMENPPEQSFLVMNGDVVTNVNFAQFHEFHKKHRAVCTIAASEYHIAIPYGVLDLAGHFVLGVKEKPTRNFFCNAGMYILDPETIHLIPKNTCYDVTTLIDELIANGYPVAAFPIREYWVDIGMKDDLQKAQSDMNILKMKGEDNVER